ncbi:short chain dehydrogenase reductase family [Trichoderma arundinaceum]|uniref:Short chain dehydrogenase reductase family n=1 Tax=Trichoderma arundinaceum TaxID=490622 RepID=A0A395NLW3_TRIAR|nr:short chain dehydrogenase reductase family [Trichoderma arundinaceum]
MERPASPTPRDRVPRKLILCFDGTGNKFHGDESDSNILKIFRMLDRTADDQYHYYQPGIGTYVVSSSLSHTSLKARFRSWYQKAKDSAVGSSFDQHVVGGYRFLMRFYNPGDEIYMFGFSRGAYIARFLAEMLDYIGLLSHGNEEMVSFAWKAFANWQSRRGGDKDEKLAEEEEKKKHEMYHFMKGFRETFSRPVGRIRFLGLFDTVNSVPRFETAWMQRSKFPYTARSSARVIRHAVSIDERRAKFRQDLMYQQANKRRRNLHGHWKKDFEYMLRRGLDSEYSGETDGTERTHQEGRGRRPSQAEGKSSTNPQNRKYMPYRARSRSAARPDRRPSVAGCNASEHLSTLDYEDGGDQDIDEVWFSGGHGDVGGGWQTESSGKNASHVPLVWMVREAMRAGLKFDLEKVQELDCFDLYNEYGSGSFKNSRTRQQRGPDILLNQDGEEGGEPVAPPSPDTLAGEDDQDFKTVFLDMMHKAHLARIHDSLEYNGGLTAMAVTAWKIMEWMPFRRMDLQADGTWKPINWPLPRGEVRDIPNDVRVHGSVIRRMKMDETYRPGNLIIGGGGRGIRVAPEEYGIGEWVCVQEEGDPIGEIWVRKGEPVRLEVDKKKKNKKKSKKNKDKKKKHEDEKQD